MPTLSEKANKVKTHDDVLADLLSFQQACTAKQVQFEHDLMALREDLTGRLEAMRLQLVGESDGNGGPANGQGLEEASQATPQNRVNQDRAAKTRLLTRNKSAQIQSLTDAETHRWAQAPLYEFQGTTWDALVLVNMGIMFWTDELAVILLGVSNFFIQLLFILIVSRNMTEGPFNEREIVEQMQDWRVMFAHDPKYANTFNNVPLAKSVCSRDPLIMEGIQQAILFTSVDDYLAKIAGLRSGLLLCMLACLLWVFTCFREVHRSLSFFVSIWCRVYDSGKAELEGLPRILSASTAIICDTCRLCKMVGDATLKSIDMDISFYRALMLSCCIGLPRIIILTYLGQVGVRFLVATIEHTELILNCVALEVILHVDELMYELFAPLLTKFVLTNMFPMRIPSSAVFQLFEPWMRLGLVGGILLVIRYTLLAPILTNLIDTRGMMCDEELEFLATHLAVGPVLAGRPIESGEINRSSYVYRAILERTGLQKHGLGSARLYIDSNSQPPLLPMQTVFDAQRYQAYVVKDFATAKVASTPFGVNCETNTHWDQVGRQPSVMNALMQSVQEKVADAHGTSCEDWKNKGWCHRSCSGGDIVRFFCPVSCGCNNFSSGIMFRGPSFGVPGDCDRVGSEKLEYAPCEDLNVSSARPEFLAFAKGMLSIFDSGFARASVGNLTHEKLLRQLVQSFATGGCSWLQGPKLFQNLADGYTVRLDVLWCDPAHLLNYGGVNSARYLCPVTCGCATTVAAKYLTDGKNWSKGIGLLENCPRKCFAGKWYKLHNLYSPL